MIQVGKYSFRFNHPEEPNKLEQNDKVNLCQLMPIMDIFIFFKGNGLENSKESIVAKFGKIKFVPRRIANGQMFKKKQS